MLVTVKIGSDNKGMLLTFCHTDEPQQTQSDPPRSKSSEYFPFLQENGHIYKWSISYASACL